MITTNLIIACQPITQLIIIFSWPFASIFGVFFLKSLWFANIGYDRVFSRWDSFKAMFSGNIISMGIGILPLMICSAPILMPGMYLISLPPAWRFSKIYPGKISPTRVALLTMILFVASTFFVFLSDDIRHTTGTTIMFWLVKLAYIYTGLPITFFLTALWEELVISNILKSSFIPEVLRMNLYIMLGFWMLITIKVLATRPIM